jgi:hypothetical protein
MALLSAHLYDMFDRCSRRFGLEKTHEPRSISPLGLLYAGIEGGLLTGKPLDAIRAITAEKDVTCNDLAVMSVVRHVGFMAEVISLALRRKLGPVTRLPDVPFGKHQWRSNLFETAKGLHRIVLVSYLDDDALRSFAHGWGTVGELAALGRDLTLTAVVIGASRGGRRHSHWTKCFQHPMQKSCLRFGRRKGGKAEGFTDAWREVWRERTDITANVWLDKMVADDVLGDLIQSRRIPYRAEDHRIETAKADMFRILPAMERASPDDPMRRHSCDDPIKGACPWGYYCWSPTAVTVEELGHLYAPRASS